MAWITTPRSLDQYAELYHQIGGMLTSGVTLVQALELIRASPPAPAFRGRLDRILGELKQGSTFSEALEQQRGWLPEFDVALIAAGEKSGRLDACCHRLSDYYRDRAKLVRGLLSDLAYPAFLIFLVILVFPPGSLARLVWQGDVAGFVLPRLKVVAVLALAELLILILNRSGRGGWWRGVWEEVLHRVPVLGKARRSMALARMAMALEALLNAGVNVLKSWELAATASGSPALGRAVGRALQGMAAGETPGEAIGQTGVFPGKFVSLYRSGEVSGRIDQSLKYLCQDYTDEASRLYKRIAEWTPRLVFILIAAMIGYFIVTFYLAYFAGMLDALDQATQGQ